MTELMGPDLEEPEDLVGPEAFVRISPHAQLREKWLFLYALERDRKRADEAPRTVKP